MSADESAEDLLRAAVEPVLGRFAWHVDAGGVGSFVRMNFGSPSVALDEAPRVRRGRLFGLEGRRVRTVRTTGEHHLWIYQCAWRVEVGGVTVVESASASHETLRELATLLDGQRWTRLTVQPDGRSSFTFDLDTTLFTWPGEADDDEQWLLYDEQAKRVLCLRGVGQVARFRSDLAEPDHGWSVLAQEVSLTVAKE